MSTEPTNNVTKMNPSQMLAYVGIDGMKWAEAFQQMRQMVNERDGDESADDLGIMVGWFANAIEAGRAEGRDSMRLPKGSHVCRCGTTDA